MKTTFKYGQKKKRYGPVLAVVLVIVIVVQAAALVSLSFRSFPSIPSKILPSQPAPQPSIQPSQSVGQQSPEPISLEGYEKVNISVSPSVIYLSSGCTQLSMVSTSFQTYSIQNGLDKKIDVRPTIHDVFKDLADNFNIQVNMVRIDSLEDSTYYANLVVQQGSKVLALDSKPSDAIAVAIRFGAPIYMKNTILADQGVKTC